MERDQDERSGFDSLADGTGMDRPDELPVVEGGDEESRTEDASGDEKAAVEGLSAIGATNRAFGTGALNAAGAIGTHVPTDEDEHMATDTEELNDSTDPRGY